MFGALFIAQVVNAVAAALEPVDKDDLVVVVEQPRLARAIAEQGWRVVMVSGKPKSLRRQQGLRIYGQASALPLGDGVARAIVVVGQDSGQSWEQRIAEWGRVVADRGVFVTVDRAAATEASRAALCAGLAEIRQRDGGRAVVTSGVVVKL